MARSCPSRVLAGRSIKLAGLRCRTGWDAFPLTFYLLFSLIFCLKSGGTQWNSVPVAVNRHVVTRCPYVSHTAHCQYGYLNTVPVFHFLVIQSNNQYQLGSTLLTAILLLLAGDIQINPGPTTQALTLCTLNVRSLFADNRSVFISDLLTSENVDIFAFAETFQNSSTTPAQLFEIIPQDFRFFGQPRCCHNIQSTRSRPANIGGGLGFLVKESLSPDLVSLTSYPSFE